VVAAKIADRQRGQATLVAAQGRDQIDPRGRQLEARAEAADAARQAPQGLVFRGLQPQAQLFPGQLGAPEKQEPQLQDIVGGCLQETIRDLLQPGAGQRPQAPGGPLAGVLIAPGQHQKAEIWRGIEAPLAAPAWIPHDPPREHPALPHQHATSQHDEGPAPSPDGRAWDLVEEEAVVFLQEHDPLPET
jgi:hypothetical protein